VALDGDGANSPFTEALVNHIATSNVDVQVMMRQVRRDVVTHTDNQQVPWDDSSLVEDFYFKKEATQPPKQEEPAKTDEDTEHKEAKHEPQVDNVDRGKKEEPREDEPDLKHVLPPDMAHVLPPDDKPVLTGKPPVHDCDRIAGSPTDPQRVTEGVVIGDLDGKAGVRACRAALAKYPNTPRFEFQLARSLLNGVFGPDVWSAVRLVQTLPFAPDPGGAVPAKRFDPESIPVNAPLPR
jgi:hypothetical protein